MRSHVVSGGSVSRVGGDLIGAHGPARAEDGLADEALLAGAVSEDAVEGPPVGAPDALTRQQPDAVMGADGHDLLQA